MTKEQEAQQAQTMARWRDKVNQPGTFLVPACEALEIVDSQAQKIAEQEKEIERLSKRGVKKYSEEELRAEYENIFSNETNEHNTWDGWIECARFLGALDAIVNEGV